MSGGGTNTVTSQGPPEWLQPYYTSALGAGQNLAAGGGPQYYPGQTVAPLNPVQEQGIQSTVNAASGPTASQGAQAANEFETSGALLNPSMNPYLQGTFNQAANQVQNQLATEFAGSGSNVINSLPVQSDEMNNLATQLYGGAYGQGLQNMTQASALAPSIDAATYLPAQQLLSTGAGLQGQTQNLINANQQAWNYNQQLPYNTLSWYSGLLGQNANPFNQGSSTGTMSNNPWSTAIGGGLLASSLYNSGLGSAIAGLFGSGAGAGAADAAAAGATDYAALAVSDRRLKKDVEFVGTTATGLPCYSFRFKWEHGSAPKSVGVMADEVEQVFPEAVVTGSDGFKRVRYDLIGADP